MMFHLKSGDFQVPCVLPLRDSDLAASMSDRILYSDAVSMVDWMVFFRHALMRPDTKKKHDDIDDEEDEDHDKDEDDSCHV